MTTLTREQAEALARFGGYYPCQCEPNCSAYINEDDEACAFNPVEDAEQFDRILRAYYLKAAKANLDRLRDIMMCGHATITDWRAAVLVAISDEVK